MLPPPGIRLRLTLTAAVAMLCSARLAAQDDPKHVPLGNVARNLRNDNPPAKPVIDDDNWSQVVDRAGCQETFCQKPYV